MSISILAILQCILYTYYLFVNYKLHIFSVPIPVLHQIDGTEENHNRNNIK